MFNKHTQAKAKLTLNKKLGMLRLLATFTAENDAKRITQRNAQFVSSDFKIEDFALQMQRAKDALGTDNIVMLG